MQNLTLFDRDELKEIITEVVRGCFDEKILPLLRSDDDEEEYYTRDEICSLLHISYPTLWRMERGGIVHSYRVGRKKLYPKKEITNIINHN